MNIYFAYRNGYKENSRHLKIFESDSILTFFQENWEKICDEENNSFIDLFGVKVYGFPIWQMDDSPKPGPPKNIIELIEIIEKYIYSNEVDGNENCIQVFTDDDEIELAWYVFNEEYKNENWDIVSIWFQEKLPTNFGSIGVSLNCETNLILPKGEGVGNTYFASVRIEDSEHLESMDGIYQIKGVRLPDFLGYLRTCEIECANSNCWNGIANLNYIQKIAKELNNNSLDQVLRFITQYPLGSLTNRDLERIKIDNIKNMKFLNKMEKSSLLISEHLCELCINIGFNMFNYIIFFDDLWLETNLNLGKSISSFVSTSRI